MLRTERFWARTCGGEEITSLVKMLEDETERSH